MKVERIIKRDDGTQIRLLAEMNAPISTDIINTVYIKNSDTEPWHELSRLPPIDPATNAPRQSNRAEMMLHVTPQEIMELNASLMTAYHNQLDRMQYYRFLPVDRDSYRFDMFIPGALGTVTISLDRQSELSIVDQLKNQIASAVDECAKRMKFRAYPEPDETDLAALVHGITQSCAGQLQQRAMHNAAESWIQEAKRVVVEHYNSKALLDKAINEVATRPDYLIGDLNFVAEAYDCDKEFKQGWLRDLIKAALVKYDVSTPESVLVTVISPAHSAPKIDSGSVYDLQP